MMPNVRQAINMWCSQVWRDMNTPIIQNNLGMFKILPTKRSATFATDDEYGKSRMKEATNELASLMSSLNLNNEEMPIEEYVQLIGEKIIDVEYNNGVEKSIWV
jgi:hypothetical protein